MDHEKVIDKVQKLLRLSTSSNANEAALAAQMAQELIEKYKLEHFQFDDAPELKETIEDSSRTRDWLDQGPSAWRGQLALSLAKANQCHVYFNGSNLALVGRKSDSEIVWYMYAYLVKEIRRLARICGEGMPGSYKNAFKRGAVDEIHKRLIDARRKVDDEMRQTHSTALVKIDNRLAEVMQWTQDNLNLKKKRTHSTRLNPDGYADGREIGGTINLGGNRALGAGNKRLSD